MISSSNMNFSPDVDDMHKGDFMGWRSTFQIPVKRSETFLSWRMWERKQHWRHSLRRGGGSPMTPAMSTDYDGRVEIVPILSRERMVAYFARLRHVISPGILWSVLQYFIRAHNNLIMPRWPPQYHVHQTGLRRIYEMRTVNLLKMTSFIATCILLHNIMLVRIKLGRHKEGNECLVGSWGDLLRFFCKTLNMSRCKLPELLKANLQQDRLILL